MNHLRLFLLAAVDTTVYRTIRFDFTSKTERASLRHVPSCHRFGGNEGHDPHILYTLSALQVMALLGELERVDRDKVR